MVADHVNVPLNILVDMLTQMSVSLNNPFHYFTTKPLLSPHVITRKTVLSLNINASAVNMLLIIALNEL